MAQVSLFGTSLSSCFMNDMGKMETLVCSLAFWLGGNAGGRESCYKGQHLKVPRELTNITYFRISLRPLHDFPVSPGFGLWLPMLSGCGLGSLWSGLALSTPMFQCQPMEVLVSWWDHFWQQEAESFLSLSANSYFLDFPTSVFPFLLSGAHLRADNEVYDLSTM